MLRMWAAIESIAGKIGCTAQTLCNWVRPAECDRGLRPGRTDFAPDALEQALHARRRAGDDALIHHSDCGVPYMSIRHTERLAEVGIEPFAASATAMTTRWPRPSMAYTRPR